MKTPDEIKKGLECCSSFDSDMCLQCPYDDGHVACCLDKNKDALAYITQLEQRLAEAERERDAAMADMENYCYHGAICKHYCEASCPYPEEDCPLYPSDCDAYEWRGVTEENP